MWSKSILWLPLKTPLDQGKNTGSPEHQDWGHGPCVPVADGSTTSCSGELKPTLPQPQLILQSLGDTAKKSALAAFAMCDAVLRQSHSNREERGICAQVSHRHRLSTRQAAGWASCFAIRMKDWRGKKSDDCELRGCRHVLGVGVNASTFTHRPHPKHPFCPAPSDSAPGNSPHGLIPLPMYHGCQSRNSGIPNPARTPTATCTPEHQWSILPALLPVSSGSSTFSAGLWFPPLLLTQLVSQRAPERGHAAAGAESRMAGNGQVSYPMQPRDPAPLSPTLTSHQHHITDFAAATSALHLDTVISSRPSLLLHAQFQEPLMLEREREVGGEIS